MMAVLVAARLRATRRACRCQAIAWRELRASTLRGLRLGLLLDAGWGLPLDAEVRAAVEAAAQRVRGRRRDRRADARRS